MISDTERREVATRLRNNTSQDMAWVIPWAVFNDAEQHDSEAVVRRLADLVEPEPERTCKMVDNGSELCCSVCDWRHDHDDEPAYCSGCGAKVVE